jgi:hypothetical protein
LEQNFGGMILGWPLPKVCPVIPTSHQDGRQAKNRKKGEEIKKKSDRRAAPPDAFLEENHPMTISSKFCSY